jgi:hypothetical protein
MRTEYYYYVDMYNDDYCDNYWLRKNLEAWTERLTGRSIWTDLNFTTREGVESFVRDVFADYCEDVVIPRGPEQLGAPGLGLTTEYRYVQDGATVEIDDCDIWTLTRPIERRTTRQIRTRKEVVVDGETYSREVVEQEHSEWSPYEHPDRVNLCTGTRTMYII